MIIGDQSGYDSDLSSCSDEFYINSFSNFELLIVKTDDQLSTWHNNMAIARYLIERRRRRIPRDRQWWVKPWVLRRPVFWAVSIFDGFKMLRTTITLYR